MKPILELCKRYLREGPLDFCSGGDFCQLHDVIIIIIIIIIMIMTLLDNTITGRTSSSYCGSLWFNFLGGY